MDLNISNLENGTATLDSEFWKLPLAVMNICNICMLACCIWVLLSVIAYGTKSRKWVHKPGTSSLSSGLVYITCTIAVILTIVRLSTTQLLFELPTIPGGLNRCELVCDVDNAAYALCLYSAYCFLWVRLRLIYNHPYVKKRIGKRANLISKIGFVLITIAAMGLLVFYTMPKSYDQSPLGCVYGKKKEHQFLQGTHRNILIAVAIVVGQTVMIYLCVYPAIRVDFYSINDGNPDNVPYSMQKRFHSVVFNTRSLMSPIQLAVRRTLISCVVMVVANVIVLIPAVIFIPRTAPAQIRRTVYNLGSFINVFCVLSTLGFAIRILTLCCPSCPRREFSDSRRFGREGSMMSSFAHAELSTEITTREEISIVNT